MELICKRCRFDEQIKDSCDCENCKGKGYFIGKEDGFDKIYRCDTCGEFDGDMSAIVSLTPYIDVDDLDDFNKEINEVYARYCN